MTAPSMHPPDTEPTKSPSASSTSWLPTGRGDEPQVEITVATATPRPSRRHSLGNLQRVRVRCAGCCLSVMDVSCDIARFRDGISNRGHPEVRAHESSPLRDPRCQHGSRACAAAREPPCETHSDIGDRFRRIVLLGTNARTTHHWCQSDDRRHRVRRHRFAKIIATLGPATSTAGFDSQSVPGRSRRVPAELQPWRPRCAPPDVRSDSRARVHDRTADRGAGRPAGSEAADWPVRRGEHHARGGRIVHPRPRSVARQSETGRASPSGGLRRRSGRARTSSSTTARSGCRSRRAVRTSPARA